jgi:restriction endonuclease S subunit
VSAFAFKPAARAGFMLASAYPGDWQSTRLRFVCDLNPSKRQLAGMASSTPVSFVPMEKVSEDGELTLDDERPVEAVSNGFTFFAEGDVVVAKITPCFENGKGAECRGLTNGFGFGTTEFHVLRPKAVDSRFLFYVTACDAFRKIGATEMSGAAGQKRVPEGFLQNLILPLPPLPTQRRIAAYLDRETARIDALVAEKEALLRLLEEKRASLISHAVTRGLNPKAKLKPSCIPWLGDVPEHWDVRRMRFLLKGAMKYGANESALSDDPDHPRFIRITDLNPDGSLRPETFKSLPLELATPYLLKEGDILFARTGATVGKALIYRDSMGPACYAGYLIRARLKTEMMLPDFLFQFTQSAAYWEQIRLGTIQATIQNFSAEKYAEMLVPLPPTIREQKEIVDFVVSATASIQSALAEIQTSIHLLREKRTSLISAAVTGEMAV